MDLRERVPFGKKGLMVNRMGLASGYGVPAAAIEKAFHDVNVCITGPRTAAQMEDNFRGLDAGPLEEEETARVRRIRKQVYG